MLYTMFLINLAISCGYLLTIVGVMLITASIIWPGSNRDGSPKTPRYFRIVGGFFIIVLFLAVVTMVGSLSWGLLSGELLGSANEIVHCTERSNV
jgi:bacteriorhodopsin